MSWSESLSNILGDAVKAYGQIEVAKASADGGAYYGVRPETIADQGYAPYMTGYGYPTTGGAASAVSPVLLVGGALLAIVVVAVMLKN